MWRHQTNKSVQSYFTIMVQSAKLISPSSHPPIPPNKGSVFVPLAPKSLHRKEDLDPFRIFSRGSGAYQSLVATARISCTLCG